MRYAKLINNYLSYAPRRMLIDDTWVYNPNNAQLRAAGYKPVINTDPPGEPPEGWEYVPGWEDQDENIMQTWTLQELPPEEPSAEELLEILLGGESL